MKKKTKRKFHWFKKPDFDEPKTMLGCHIFLDQGMEGVPLMHTPKIFENVRFISDVKSLSYDKESHGYGSGYAIGIIENGVVEALSCNVNMFTEKDNVSYVYMVNKLYKEALKSNEIIVLK